MNASDFPRHLLTTLLTALGEAPAVVLLGPRQVGKTTLALAAAKGMPHVYLDLESEGDRNKLGDAAHYLQGHSDKLVILDEVHRTPHLFPALRGLIDQARREQRKTGLYLLLGSASLDLLKQSGESLAGRTAYLELGGLHPLEIVPMAAETLWVRGGFPDSLLANSEARSLRWRQDFIRTYLEREITQFLPAGSRVPTATLRQLWTMLAHTQGSIANSAHLARALGIDVRTVNHYVDLLCELFLVRRLPPWYSNVGKRLVKSPKLYWRDSGLVHALLGIANKEQLLAHPVAGLSWEGFVIESVLACLPSTAQASFYRSHAGAEIDLVLTWPGTHQAWRHWAIEIKRSLAPKLERGFYAACTDLQPERRWVVYPGQEQYTLAEDIQAISLNALCELLSSLG
jgi:predicted AAA+ superfamily ATPase